jgi:hypothetical protein
MAYSLQKIILEENTKSGVIIMGGHEEGILFYNTTISKASKMALDFAKTI